jgi:phosphoglycolate phosphatase
MNIFFDLDGTLLDSRERLYKLFCDLTKQSILDLNQYWNLKRAMHDHRKILNEYCNYSFDDVLLFEAEWMKLIEAEEYLRFDLPFPFTVNVLKRLKSEKIDLHMVTSRQSRPGVMRQLERLGLYSFFTNILVTESVMTKSQLIIDSNVYLTDKDIFVGDTGLDIKTAKVIGIRSLAVLSGFRNKSVLAKYNPEYIENDIRAVLNYV